VYPIHYYNKQAFSWHLGGIVWGSVIFSNLSAGECPRKILWGNVHRFREIFGKIICRENVWRNVGELSGIGVQIPLQDFKFLYRAIMICATLVNTHMHAHIALNLLQY